MEGRQAIDGVGSIRKMGRVARLHAGAQVLILFGEAALVTLERLDPRLHVVQLVGELGDGHLAEGANRCGV